MVPGETEDNLHRIVVVGGGAAGLQLATKLGETSSGARKKAHVTLVDRARTHIWKPLLHEVAAGSLDVGHHAVDYLHHAHRHHFRYRIGEMTGPRPDQAHDPPRRRATTPRAARSRPCASIPYDTLVMAVGSTTNDFGTPGVQGDTPSPSTPRSQAVRFHQRLVNGMLRAHTQAGSGAARPAPRHGDRRRRDRHRARGRAPPHHPRRGRHRPRPDRPGQGPQDHPGRGGRAASCRRCRSASPAT